jgi:two-component system, cell cycle response regulator
LILCDIDHFKIVNDTYGHQAGDQVLVEFVNCIKESFRNKIDWIARYGGEEFIVVLPETNVEGAKVLAERLRIKISHQKTQIDHLEIKITASFGVAGFTHQTDKEKISDIKLITKADQLLYQAKKEGRNRIKAASL